MAEALAPKKRRKPPVSRHPLFAVTLALWCAALLSIAALALHLPGGVLAALALAVIGGLAGFALARRIARPAAPVQRAAEQPVNREPEAAHMLEIAPEPEILDVASFGIAGFEEPDIDERSINELSIDEPTIEEPRALPVADRTARAAPSPEPAPPRAPTAAERLLAADPAELSHLQLLERLALSLDSRGLPAPLPAELVRELEMAVEAPPACSTRRSENPPPEGPEQALRDALAALQRMSGAA